MLSSNSHDLPRGYVIFAYSVITGIMKLQRRSCAIRCKHYSGR